MNHKYYRRNLKDSVEELQFKESPKSVYVELAMKKREVIMMKGAMNRIAPYNPVKNTKPNEHKAVENWTKDNYEDPELQADARERRNEIPEMHANAKVRALHKMTGLTQVRRHPKTGERMFLLHRGMNDDEFTQNHQNGKANYPPGSLTSWTPKYSVAKDFASDVKTGKKHVVSAWIPESHIHNVPNQITIPDQESQFRNEHEVIVNHQSPQLHAHKEIVRQASNPRLFLDNKINMKGLAEQAQKNPFDIDAAVNVHLKRAKRAEEFKRNKFGKREAISMKTLAKSDISSKIKNGVAGLAIAAAAMSPMNSVTDKRPDKQQVKQETPKPTTNRKERILSSIMDVESSGGKNTQHAKLPKDGIHRGERAYGKFGLTPLLIRETVKKHPDLNEKHGNLVNMTGDDVHNYMNKNPDLEKEIASRHYDRLATHFGHNVDKIAMAWLNGVSGTKKAIKQNQPLQHHWHVAKVKEAYNKRKKAQK